MENKAVIEGLLKALLAKLLQAKKHDGLGESEKLNLSGNLRSYWLKEMD
ncbi:hypothetical protein R9C00_21385 [Flammeovirgaceae bacterium SG7u.111]|nr:hypothetical protein [Flammeovirgaceae bacterium SG7u.132]WPO34255.1 hypothetical protein R9C00_21385 [Flammeovirgaceae bacterium SG7u.111]